MFINGIKNLGNTCFLAVTLQALFSIPNFVSSIEHHQLQCFDEEVQGIFCLKCGLARCQTHISDTLIPAELVQRIKADLMPSYIPFTQQDAAECLRTVIMNLTQNVDPSTPLGQVRNIKSGEISQIRKLLV